MELYNKGEFENCSEFDSVVDIINFFQGLIKDTDELQRYGQIKANQDIVNGAVRTKAELFKDFHKSLEKYKFDGGYVPEHLIESSDVYRLIAEEAQATNKYDEVEQLNKAKNFENGTHTYLEHLAYACLQELTSGDQHHEDL